MTSVPFSSTGAGDVSKLLGEAYLVVKDVQENLTLIQEVNDNMDGITEAVANLSVIIGSAATASAALDLAGSYVSALVSMGSVDAVYRSKATAMAMSGGVAADAFVSVLTDETKAGQWAIYQKKFGLLEYVTTVGTTVDPGVELGTATGVFYNSAETPFTALSFPVNAALTVNSGNVLFDSATTLELDLLVKDGTGAVLEQCFDYVKIEADVTLTSYPAAGVPGTIVNMEHVLSGIMGLDLAAHGGTALQTIPALLANNSVIESAGGIVLGAGLDVTVVLERLGNVLRATLSRTGEADIVYEEILTYATNDHELPRLFNRLGVQFRTGNSEVTRLVASALFPNADKAFVGDSLTQGRFTTQYSEGFAQLHRADSVTVAKPLGDVLVAGAPSATTADWLARVDPLIQMAPRKVNLMLGTNDILLARATLAFQNDYSDFLDALVAAGIIPIINAIPPCGSALAPTWNTWLEGLGFRFIDTNTPLLAVGSTINMNPAYVTTPGVDEVHPNTAGNLVIYNTQKDYYTAEGI